MGNYLTFASDTAFTIGVYNTTKNWDGTLYYSTDTETWSEWDGTTTLSSAEHNSQQCIYMRGSGNTEITDSSSNNRFVLTGTNISCSGNIENLLDFETVASGERPIMRAYCYAYMFQNCTSLTTPPELPATTLASWCYWSMFDGCTSLTTPPDLPATTLAQYCYQFMFRGCTSLTSAPELPATTLVEGCYNGMFSGCTSLTSAPELPATTLASYCYQYMFSACTNLITAPELPATTLASWCYRAMFRDCTSLTTPPDLPATTLAQYCYMGMFYDCTSLTRAPDLPATTLVDSCYGTMFYGCTGIKLSTEQTVEYWKKYRIPKSGTGTTATDALTDMFAYTGGTFTGTPEINTTYYIVSTEYPTVTPGKDFLLHHMFSKIIARALSTTGPTPTLGFMLLSSDGYILKDVNGLNLIPKEGN